MRFEAKRSSAFLCLLSLLLPLGFLYLGFAGLGGVDQSGSIIAILLGLFGTGALLSWFHRLYVMVYEIGKDAIYIRVGNSIFWEIPYNTIIGVSVTGMEWVFPLPSDLKALAEDRIVTYKYTSTSIFRRDAVKVCTDVQVKDYFRNAKSKADKAVAAVAEPLGKYAFSYILTPKDPQAFANELKKRLAPMGPETD